MYNIDTNLLNYKNDIYVDYISFNMEPQKEYYINYYVKDTTAVKGDYEYYDYLRITKGLENYESVIYNKFLIY